MLGVTLSLVAPNTAAVGTAVPLVIRITNTGSQPQDVYFTGKEIAFDFVVRAADGSVVWRRLAGKTVQSILQVRTFKPGETLELRDTWKPTIPGEYTIEGIVPGQEREPMRTAVRSIVLTP